MQAEQLRAVSVGRDEGDPYWFTNNRMTVKVRAADTDGAFGVVEGTAPAGSSPPLHVHHREHELFLLLEGSLTVRCGDESFRAEPGSVTFLPRDVPHTFCVEGEQPARLLSICIPGGFEDFFVAAGRSRRERRDAGERAAGRRAPPAGRRRFRSGDRRAAARADRAAGERTETARSGSGDWITCRSTSWIARGRSPGTAMFSGYGS